MKNILVNFGSAAVYSFFLVFPFMILELVNRRNFHEGFPISLFSSMWFWAMLFFVILMPLVRNVRARKSIIANPTTFLLSVIGLTLITWLWVSLLIDQIPCFMGVPICD